MYKDFKEDIVRFKCCHASIVAACEDLSVPEEAPGRDPPSIMANMRVANYEAIIEGKTRILFVCLYS